MMRGIALICRAALIFVFFCLCIFLFPQDVENISPVADKITRRDVEKLPMDELESGIPDSKQGEQQCMALREALQNCKNRWHALCPQ